MIGETSARLSAESEARRLAQARATEYRVTRLTPEVYADLLKKCPAIMVTAETSAMQAGFQLGVQHILKLLREGYLTEVPPA